MVATRCTGIPATASPGGMPGMSSASASNPTTVSASKTRSTATEASEVVRRAPVSRLAATVRTTSPARNGRRLFAANPIATACQRGSQG